MTVLVLIHKGVLKAVHLQAQGPAEEPAVLVDIPCVNSTEDTEVVLENVSGYIQLAPVGVIPVTADLAVCPAAIKASCFIEIKFLHFFLLSSGDLVVFQTHSKSSGWIYYPYIIKGNMGVVRTNENR